MIEQYSAPGSVAEATRVMHEGKVTVLAGGTDLMPQTESGKRQFETTLLNMPDQSFQCRRPVEGGEGAIGRGLFAHPVWSLHARLPSPMIGVEHRADLFQVDGLSFASADEEL